GIADHHAGDELGVIAADLLLDSLNIAGKFDTMMKYIERFAANPELMKDKEFGDQVRNMKAQSRWKHADMMAKSKKYKEAANMYVEIFNEAPDAPRSAQTLYNAALMFESARLVGRAIQAR